MKIPTQEIEIYLKKEAPVIITAHKNPDGDAVGSALGWYHILKHQGFDCTVILPDSFPDFLRWMPESEKILFYDKHPQDSRSLVDTAGVVFCLDYNSLSRTGDLAVVLEKSNAPRILIDHHPEPVTSQFVVSFSDIRGSSTSEMIASLALSLNYKITPEAAQCLYAGIVTDTGSFRFSSTTSHTHYIAQRLMETGIHTAEIHRNVYDTNSFDRLKLVGYALSEKLILLKELKTAYLVLTKEELRRYNYRKGDTEGLVNYGLSIEGVSVAAIFTEHEGEVKMSFRSFGEIPVNELAGKYFQGGGHKNAAGGRLTIPVDEVVTLFKRVLPEFIERYA